jgi:broad specificity phosphatase PhoE
MMISRSLVALALASLLSVSAAAQQAFLVRHAERADTVSDKPPAKGADPDLSDEGRARAASLAAVLKDAEITAIFATEFKRTQQTAAPLAKALGLKVMIVPSANTADLIAQIKSSKGNVLVVGHSNTIPDVIKGLGGKTTASIAEDEFDNLFVVTRGAAPTVLRLHYR